MRAFVCALAACLLVQARCSVAEGLVADEALSPVLARQLLFDEPNQHLQELGQISDTQGSLVRTFMSPAHFQAAKQLRVWMEEAGMRTWVDQVGNVHGRVDSADKDAPAFIMGSHYDTVVDGGKYDGALGIIVPIAAAKALTTKVRLAAEESCQPASERVGECSLEDAGKVVFQRPFEVIAFSDEEGVRFGSTFLGSRAVAGTLVKHGLLESKDKDGSTLSEVLTSMGFNGSVAAVEEIAYKPQDVSGYLEVHMEQGPVLKTKKVPLGAVSAIAGQTRLSVSMSGTQGHAGTVPMKIRQDCIAAAAEAIAWMEKRCGGGFYEYSHEGGEQQHPGAANLTDADMLVCTTGAISIWPGASNVISGSVNFTIDIRSAYDSIRHSAVADVKANINGLCSRRGISCEVAQPHSASGVLSEPGIVGAFLGAATASRGLMKMIGAMETEEVGGAADVPVLVSGAGHDALAMADITKVGMVFVRCGNNGISHSPLEYVAPADVAAVTAALYKYLDQELMAPST